MDTSSTLDLDEIIATVAKEQGIALSKDDPLLSTVLFNEAVIKAYTNIVQHNLAQLREDLEVFHEEAGNGIRERVEQELKHVLDDAKQEFLDASTQACQVIKNELGSQAQRVDDSIEGFNKSFRRQRNITILCAFICISAVVTAFVLTR